jgi:hypothetical protein
VSWCGACSGGITQLFASNRLAILAPTLQRTLRSIAVNTAVSEGRRLTLDIPQAVFTNQHFLSGDTMLDDSGRVEPKNVTGLSAIDINVETGAASPEVCTPVMSLQPSYFLFCFPHARSTSASCARGLLPSQSHLKRMSTVVRHAP